MKCLCFVFLYLFAPNAIASNSVIFEDEDNNSYYACREMKETGDFLSLFAELKTETQIVHTLLESPDEEAREQVASHTKIIEGISQKIALLSTPGMNYEQFGYDAHWLITEKNFRNKLGSYLPRGFSLYSAEIESVYYKGEKRDDLKSYIKLGKTEGAKNDTLYVSFSRTSSLLFLCQLKKTLIINVKVKARNLYKYKDYTVNLYING